MVTHDNKNDWKMWSCLSNEDGILTKEDKIKNV